MNTLEKFNHFKTVGFVGLSTLFDWQSHAEQEYILASINEIFEASPDLTSVKSENFDTGWVEADVYYWELDEWQNDASSDLWSYLCSHYRYGQSGMLDSQDDFGEITYLQYQSRHDAAIELMEAIVDFETYYLVFENQAGHLPIPDNDIDCYSEDDAKDAVRSLIEDYFIAQDKDVHNMDATFKMINSALELKHILALTPDESIEIQIDETVFNLVCKEL